MKQKIIVAALMLVAMVGGAILTGVLKPSFIQPNTPQLGVAPINATPNEKQGIAMGAIPTYRRVCAGFVLSPQMSAQLNKVATQLKDDPDYIKGFNDAYTNAPIVAKMNPKSFCDGLRKSQPQFFP